MYFNVLMHIKIRYHTSTYYTPIFLLSMCVCTLILLNAIILNEGWCSIC
nr:MAG TPA: hypothetical protein [Caudoviricetes sp.]